jgi:hypothetical protein
VLAQHFCYWLQGAIELGNLAQPLTLEQKETIMKHVSLVVPSRKPAYELLPADALVFRIKMLNESAVEWGQGVVWLTLLGQLHQVFEHQLDKEVPFYPDHLHNETLRC